MQELSACVSEANTRERTERDLTVSIKPMVRPAKSLRQRLVDQRLEEQRDLEEQKKQQVCNAIAVQIHGLF